MAQIIEIKGTTGDRGTGAPTLLLYKRDEFLQQLENDLDNVFIGSNGQEFAEDQNTVEYRHVTGEVRNYPVIMDNPTTSQNLNTDAEFNGLRPQAMIQETKLARPVKHKDRVKIRGVWYFVEDYKSDGVGVTTIFIRRK